MAQINKSSETPSWGETITDVIWYIMLLPFIPIVIGIAFFFGWIIKWKNTIPEDLDEQGGSNNAE